MHHHRGAAEIFAFVTVSSACCSSSCLACNAAASCRNACVRQTCSASHRLPYVIMLFSPRMAMVTLSRHREILAFDTRMPQVYHLTHCQPCANQACSNVPHSHQYEAASAFMPYTLAHGDGGKMRLALDNALNEITARCFHFMIIISAITAPISYSYSAFNCMADAALLVGIVGVCISIHADNKPLHHILSHRRRQLCAGACGTGGPHRSGAPLYSVP